MSVVVQKRSYNLFGVTFSNFEFILTTVTSYGYEVEQWINEILRIHRRRLSHLVVGLDTEWRPCFKKGEKTIAAVLQLCVGRRCLIFHINHADYIPSSLFKFLIDPHFRFVGVGIDGDINRLKEDYHIDVYNFTDLREMAAQKMGRPELKKTGLKGLCKEVMGVNLNKPKEITLSEWHKRYLKPEQIGYACVDAFVSFEIGRKLANGDFN